MDEKLIGHFRIEEQLGEGGMGVVYRAIDTQDGKRVALKVISHHALLDEEVKHRFLREANAGSQLVHPNIVKIYEVGEAEGQHYISMEYIDGKTLQEILKEGPLQPGRVVEIGIAVGEALRAAHEKGIVHRDIKSLNIMISASGDVKVMDFGLAKIQNASMLTREGEILGTVTYMSPEQASGETVDYRTDIFSLGVVLYELLTGKLPFGDQYDMAVVYAILNVEPAAIRETRPEVPEALETIVLKAMRKDLQHRYQNVEELLGDLRRMKAFLDGKRDEMPSALELVAGTGVEEFTSRQTHLSRGPGMTFEAKCAGRETELEKLKALLRKADAGEGHTVLIAGEAGVGKTRLVTELEQYARTIKIHPLNCRCAFQEGSAAYRPFMSAVRDIFTARGLMDRHDLENYFATRSPALIPHLPTLQLFLGATAEEEEIRSKDQLWEALLKLFEAISHERTFFLFIDDLHWADEESLRLLQYISRNSKHMPVFLIGTYRPEEISTRGGVTHPLRDLEEELSKEGCLTTVRLDRLTENNIEQMVGSLFPGAQFGKTFVGSLFQESGGNPLFVMEILKLLKTEGVVQAEAGTYRLKGDLESVGMPSRIQDIVVRRVARLGRKEREVLEIGAVEGEVFYSDTIGRCLESNRLTVLRTLQSLERDYHIIRAQGKSYRFDHAKIREALYDAISPELRTEYHRLIGEYVEQEHGDDPEFSPQIALHFMAGGEDRRALPFLIRGGEHARALFANLRAVEFFDQALHIASKEEHVEGGHRMKETEVILEGLGEVNTMLGNHDRARDVLTQLLSYGGLPPIRRADLLQKMGTIDLSTGNQEEALNRLAEAARLCEEAGGKDNAEARVVLGKVLVTRARVFKGRGEYDAAVKEIDEGLRLLGHEGQLHERADALNDLANICEDRSDYTRAQEIFSESLHLREEIADKKGIAVTYNNLANIFCAQGDYPNAATMFRKSLDLMKEIGYRAGIAGTCNNLGTIYQDQGRFREALDLQKTGLHMREEIGDRPGIAMSIGNIGFVHLDLREFDAAREFLSKSVQMQEELGMKTLLSATTSWLALATAECGDMEGGLRLARKALAIAADLGQKWFEGIASRSVGVILRMKWGLEVENEAKRILYSESLENLRRSFSVFYEGKFEHEAARSSLELGILLDLGGEKSEGGRHRQQAIEVFQKLGAMGDLDRALKSSTHH
jgi:tetratricopeptide (TPR) repeat protein/predicted Ser/Thr protein kinase